MCLDDRAVDAGRESEVVAGDDEPPQAAPSRCRRNRANSAPSRRRRFSIEALVSISSGDLGHLPRAEVEAPVELLEGIRRSPRARGAGYESAAIWTPSSETSGSSARASRSRRLPVELGPGIGSRERDLERVRVDLAREADRVPDRLVRLARQAHDERAVDRDAEPVAVLREAPRRVDPGALADVVQDLLAAGLVSDEEQPQPVLPHDLAATRRGRSPSRCTTTSRRACRGARRSLRAREVVREGVVVEEVLLDLREEAVRAPDLLGHVFRRARAVAVAADRLGPEAERAPRAAAAPRVQRDVGVEQVADEVVLDDEVAARRRR